MMRDSKGKPTMRDSKGRARKKPKRPGDVNQLAHLLGKLSTEEQKHERSPTKAETSRVMAALGRKGGKIGGHARAAVLSKQKRKAIAQKAANARWANKLANNRDMGGL